MVILVKNIFLNISFLFVLAVAAGPAIARVDDGTTIDPAIIKPLMVWVEKQTGQKVPVLPRVIASRTQFHKILVSMGSEFIGRPQALYVPGTIFVDHLQWDPADYVQLSLVVHELVHHAQLFMVAKQWPCADAREAQAYQIQNQWLDENKHSPFVQANWIERVSACPNQQQLPQLVQAPH